MPGVFSPVAAVTPAGHKLWLQRLALVGLYIWALFGWLGVAGAAIGAAMLMFACIFDGRAWRLASREPVFWFVMAMIVYLLARTAWAIWELPVTRKAQISAAGDWLQLLMFLPVAWYLGADVRRLGHVWALAAIGLLAGTILFVANPENRNLVGSDARSGFHLGAPIPYGLYSGVVVLGLLIMAPRIWGLPVAMSGWRVLVWLAMLIAAAQGLLQTFSRGALLAMALVAPAAIAAAFLSQPGRLRDGTAWLIGMLALTSLAALLVFNHDALLARLKSEPEAVAAVLAGKPLDAPTSSSIGARLHLWKVGLDDALERPIFGWGPGSTRHRLSQPDTANFLGSDLFFHLHNSYIEVFLRFGGVGVAFGLALVAILARALQWAARTRRLPRDYVIFLTAAAAFAAVWMMFEFQSLRYHWRFFWNVLAGSMLTFYLHRRTQEAALAT